MSADVTLGRPWIGQAGEALRLAIAKDLPGAAKVIKQMQADHGDETVISAMAEWIDTLANHGGWRETEGPIAFAFRAVETGEVTRDENDVRPTVAWAGKMLTARLALDEAAWWALIRAVPQDPAVIGDHVTELLQCVALAWHPGGTQLLSQRAESATDGAGA